MRGARSNTADDLDRTKDALHKLRNENRKLRKENAQLKKELHKVAEFTFDKELEYEEEIVPQEKPKPVDKLKCGKCKSENIVQIEAGIFMISKCNDCGHKKSKKT